MKPKFYLLGQHINHTPFAHHCYRQLLDRYFSESNDIKGVDYVIMGRESDISDHQKDLADAIASNPLVKLFVISEKPYWDLFISQPSEDKRWLATIGQITFPYSILSYSTTDIFKFEHLPYSITTDNKYIARYRQLFSRNAGLSADQLVKHLEKAKYQIAMFAGRRDHKKVVAANSESELMELMQFRTNLMTAYQAKGALVMGQGWHTNEMKQQLPDWHLDKLARLDCKSRVTSALENTHHIDYISEKFFDSMACLSVPIFYAQKEHSIFKLAEDRSFIKLSKRNIVEAVKAIDNFEVNKNFVNSYRSTQKYLNGLLCDNLTLVKQRAYFTARFLDELLYS